VADASAKRAVALDFQPLDPRVIQLWRVRQLITSAVLLGIALLSVVSVGVGTGGWLWLWLGFAALAALRITLFFWYPARAYRGWGYRLDGKVLETREGIWFRSLTLLPLSRLQHVDLHSGPIQRSFGLASLLLHTAGTQHATIVIPGLDAAQAARLRDQLVAVGGDDAV
jgi:membrane protein YdbS with pleckstrin-like domain